MEGLTATQVSRYFKKKDVRTILFDLDNTILNTHAVFVRVIDQVIADISKALELDSKLVDSKFNTLLLDAHGRLGVNPVTTWPDVLGQLGGALGCEFCDDLYRSSYSSLNAIYTGTHVPQIYDGAVDLLSALTEAGLNVGLVTHASEEWTDLKLNHHGLTGYFRHIEICDVDKPKTPSYWLNAVNSLGASVGSTIVVGDSLKGDIIASREVGIPHQIWINPAKNWVVNKSGDIPQGVVVVDSLSSFIDIIASS